MALYGDWANAVNLDIEQLDWEEIGRIKSSELETPLPKRYKLEEELDCQNVRKQIDAKKRYKNVYIPEAKQNRDVDIPGPGTYNYKNKTLGSEGKKWII